MHTSSSPDGTAYGNLGTTAFTLSMEETEQTEALIWRCSIN